MLWANEVPGGFVHTGIVDSQPQNTRKEEHGKDQEWFVLSGRRHVFGFININDCEITQLDAMDALDPDDPAKLTREDRQEGVLLVRRDAYDVVEQEGRRRVISIWRIFICLRKRIICSKRRKPERAKGRQ